MGPETKVGMNGTTALPEGKRYSLVKDRWPLLVLIAVVVLLPLLSRSYFMTRLGVVLSINAIMVVGMTLLIRYAGIFSMGQAAFFAIGAYLSGVLTVHAHMNPWLAMVIAALGSVFAAYLFCAPFLKLRAIMLAIATLGLATVIHIVAKNLDDITGGVAGLPDIPYLHIGSYVLGKDWQIFYLCGAFLIFFAFLSDNVGRTRLGRAYHAIRSNETAAQASGIDVQRNMRNIFCFSALVASVAGSLLAHFITFISPESFLPEVGLTLLIVVIIGGANVWAGILTTVILLGFSEASRGFQDLSTGLYALLLMVIFFVFPDGLSSVLFSVSRAAKRAGEKYLGTEPVGSVAPDFRVPSWRRRDHFGDRIDFHVLWRHCGSFRCFLLCEPRSDRRHHRSERGGQDDPVKCGQRVSEPCDGQGVFQGPGRHPPGAP